MATTTVSDPSLQTSTDETTGRLVDVAPDLLEQWLTGSAEGAGSTGGAGGDTVLVDVREDFEHATERIADAHHAALSKLDCDQLRATHGDKRIVFHCRTGRRSAQAAARFQRGDEPVFHLAGGLVQWKASGRATIRSASAPRLDVMRQVQMTAGSLVLIGVLLGAFVSPWFLILSGFVGTGLVFAGASGWCGMAMLLSRTPWNKRSSNACDA